jgi:GNAT superfamily N-acetyltransferase
MIRRGADQAMTDEIAPTDLSMRPEGFRLFRDAYLLARQANGLLPALTLEHEARLRRRVERAFEQGGVAAMRDGRLQGFMVASPTFDFRGRVAALVPEYGHAVTPSEEATLYPLLYAAVAERLVQAGAQLHLIGHLAADVTVREALYGLGFGAIVCERLRDLSDPQATSARFEGSGGHVEHAGHERPWDEVATLAAQHAAYYRASPLFLHKDDTLEAARSDLEAHRQAGDQLFVYRRGARPLAYLVVGRCPGASEGRLLQGTSTAQIRSAYAVPEARRRGIGSALLQHAVAWAREGGFERLFVEHETANLHGGPFWRRHFEAFALFSLRYVQAP